MPHDRLIALTLCLREAADSGDTDQLALLLAQRDAYITDLYSRGERLSPETMERVQSAEKLVFAAFAQRKTRIVGRLREINSVKQARKTYRAA
ncbi:MAG TPA: hypothetical protein VG944_05235 [Fimbriimonas sp.]|nr:hypothetical protein [Fimbriimonas sp.]